MYSFAPLEGITDTVYRRIHHKHFPGLSAYYIPFVSPTQNMTLTSREYAALSPEENAGIPAIPQVLTKEPEHFLWTARHAADLGYSEINLNLGCPSGTVTAKGKGAGALRDLDALRRLLDGVFSASPLPVSIKTRIGYEKEEEWPSLLALFSQYPVKTLIIHPRTRAQLYHDLPSLSAWEYALSASPFPLIYNGDLHALGDLEAFFSRYPSSSVMLGRGLLQNPALARQAQGGKKLTLSELIAFHDDLLNTWQQRHPRNVALNRMREVMKYMCLSFENPDKPLKIIRKAKTLDEYFRGTEMLFSQPFHADSGETSWVGEFGG